MGGPVVVLSDLRYEASAAAGLGVTRGDPV
jgi:hypothetical protein